MKQKSLKMIAAVAAAAILAGLGWFANGLLGNPVSKALAAKTVEEYLAETYPDTDFYMERLGYSFKEVGYYAHIKSPSSQDSDFTLTLDMLGRLDHDDYQYRVVERENTADRIRQQYRELVDTVLESSSFPYETSIAYGDLEFRHDQKAGDGQEHTYALHTSELELDKVYDIPALGSKAGHLILYVEQERVDIESMANILLDIKDIFSKAGIPFYAVDLVLESPETEKDQPGSREVVEVFSFHYSDIYEEGLAERVHAADAAVKAYYAEQDGKGKN